MSCCLKPWYSMQPEDLSLGPLQAFTPTLTATPLITASHGIRS